MRNAARARGGAAAGLLLIGLGSPALAQPFVAEDAPGGALEGWAPATDPSAVALATPGGLVALPGQMPRELAPHLGGFFGFPYVTPPPPAPEGEPGRAIDIRGGLTGQLRATDNVFPGSAEKQADLVTTITPDLLVTLDTVRLQGRIFYAPSYQAYASDSDQNRLDHRLNGSLLATIVPGSVFLDLHGQTSVQSITGGFAGSDESSLPRRDRAQTVAFSATPYGIHRFGGLATAIVGYTLQYGSQGGTARSLTPGGTPFYTPQEFTGHTGFAAIRTGEDFGRLALEARVSGTTYTGDGVLDGAHRAIGSVEARYAITREIAVLGELGYEDQSYNGTPPFEISEPIWGFGIRLDPGPDSFLILRYQRRDGFNSPSALGRVAIGPRTILSGSYSDRLTTTARRAVDLLSTTSVDELGNAVDTATGSPSLASVSGSGLAQQSALIRVKMATAAITQVWDRDTVTLSFTREERIPISTAANAVSFQQKSESVALTWAHSVSPVTTLIGSVQYGRFESRTLRNSGNSYLLRATAVHQLSETLTASLQYQVGDRFTDLADRDSPNFGERNRLQHAVIVTLRKSF